MQYYFFMFTYSNFKLSCIFIQKIILLNKVVLILQKKVVCMCLLKLLLYNLIILTTKNKIII